MHQHNIKRNFLQHHSIPILLARGIPIGCIVALLLLIFSSLFYGKQVLAGSMPCDGKFPEGYEYMTNESYEFNEEGELIFLCDYIPSLTSPKTIVLTPTISMTIDNSSSVSKQIQAEYNKANYSAHTVAVSASNISDYTLTLSNVSMTGPSTLTGASNVKGSALSNNTWGYGWDSTATSNDDVTYSSASSKSLGDTPVSNNSVNLSKKLVFATKFGEDASSGGYKVRATLSLVATPATVTDTYVHWDDMVYMQDMTVDACSEATTSTPEKILTDIRDDSTYTVKKLSDGKCWMTQNLRITGDSMKEGLNKTITQYDSNVSANYTIPASALWSDTAATTDKAYYNNNTAYGAYYTYYTATAGTNPSSGDASYDICPKNWRLPMQAEYGTLISKGTEKAGTWSDNSSTTSGYWIGGAANASTAAFWYAAGGVNSGSLDYAGVNGYYWSSTAANSGYAYRLSFVSGNTPNTNNYYKYLGLSVRCVAK